MLVNPQVLCSLGSTFVYSLYYLPIVNPFIGSPQTLVLCPTLVIVLSLCITAHCCLYITLRLRIIATSPLLFHHSQTLFTCVSFVFTLYYRTVVLPCNCTIVLLYRCTAVLTFRRTFVSHRASNCFVCCISIGCFCSLGRRYV